MEHFFSPNSSGDLRSDADQSQIIAGDADVAVLKLLGEIQSNYWGVISPPSFGTPGSIIIVRMPGKMRAALNQFSCIS